MYFFRAAGKTFHAGSSKLTLKLRISVASATPLERGGRDCACGAAEEVVELVMGRGVGVEAVIGGVSFRFFSGDCICFDPFKSY